MPLDLSPIERLVQCKWNDFPTFRGDMLTVLVVMSLDTPLRIVRPFMLQIRKLVRSGRPKVLISSQIPADPAVMDLAKLRARARDGGVVRVPARINEESSSSLKM